MAAVSLVRSDQSFDTTWYALPRCLYIALSARQGRSLSDGRLEARAPKFPVYKSPVTIYTVVTFKFFRNRRATFVTETMILIPGRSSKQGTSLNAGKLKDEYRTVTSTVEVNADDMGRLGIKDGDRVRLRSAFGETVVQCKGRKPADLPAGTLFIAYGPPSSQLMGGDTAGSGMPISKNFEVEIEPVRETSPA